ncbi:hypothetical protein MMC13_006501 [Lambiella insularis]|nr:hypothetical protein [Lambiella insularis]
MPPKQRKPPVRRSYETIDRPRQTHFTPQHRTVSTKNHSLSAPNSRQQTLTQIDFVSRLPVEEEDVDMGLQSVEEAPRARKRRKTMPAVGDEGEDGDDATYVEEQPRVKKRRTTMPEATSKVNRQKTTTKESKRRTTKGRQHEEGEEVNQRLSQGEGPRLSAGVMMPPPRTPRTIKTEIPSSQSPSNTPLSMRSRRSVRNDSRSPLKARSTNTCTPRMLQSDDKGNRIQGKIPRVPKLLIRDTFDSHSEGSDISVQSRCSESRLMEQAQLGVLTFPVGEAVADSCLINADESTSLVLPTGETALEPATERHVSTSGLHKRQGQQAIEPIAQGSISQNGDDAEEFDAGLDTQAALENVGHASNPGTTHRRKPDPVEDFNNAIRAAAARSFSASTKSYTEKNTRRREPTTSRQARGIRTTDNNLPVASVRRIIARSPELPQVPRTPPLQRSDSDEASAQLNADLHRQTQPAMGPLIKTETLSDGALQLDSTPILIDYDDRASNNDAYHTPSTPSSVRPAAPPSHHLNSIPLSQATTVDVTQPTQHSPPLPHIQVPSSPQAPSLPALRKSKSDGLPTLQRPVTPFILSSSPVGSGGEPSSQYEWDGKPVTDSQLLPDSLMDMPVPKPPWGSSQESLLEE